MLISDLVLIHHKGPLSSLPARQNSLFREFVVDAAGLSQIKHSAVALDQNQPLSSYMNFDERSFTASQWFEWKTCLRQIAVGFSEKPGQLIEGYSEHFEVYYGQAAYEQILEVICGLQSPLFGETEVFGQFKENTLRFSVEDKYWDKRFRKVFTKLLSDAKKVRNEHLRHSGSQSYGSIVRKETRSLHQMVIMGSGHLTREILPWVVKEKNFVEVLARNTQKAKIELPYSDMITLSDYESQPRTREPFALVVAAPVSAEEIHSWFEKSNLYPELIIDLRAESAHDPIRTEARLIDLHSVFARIESTRAQQSELKMRAQEHIRQLSALRVQEFECRPFGWDELCGL